MGMIEHRGPDLGDGTFLNPILGGDYPDPSVLRVGEDYYLTHSTFMYGPGLLIWHSRDLVNWEPVCNANSGYEGNIWAPDFIRFSNTFYIYYYADGTNWVVYAPDPKGPWSKPVDLKIGCIDPGHAVDHLGNRYLYLAGGSIARLSADGLKVVSEPEHTHSGWTIPEDWVVECGGGKTGYEGPKITFKDGFYYLTMAQGGTAGPATSHMVTSSRARTPFGPWELSPYNPVIHTGQREDTWWSRGHGTLVDTPDGDWWMIYHAYEKNYHTLGRQTLLEPVEWTDDGWFQVPGDIRPDLPIRKPMGSIVKPGLRLSNDFTQGPLGLQWRFYSEFSSGRYSFTPNGLEIQAKGISPANCSPMLCIPMDHAYEAQVDVTVLDGATVGLLLYYSPKCYCGVEFTGSRINTVNAIYGSAGSASLDGREVCLRLVNDHHQVSFYYSTDAISFHKTDVSFDTTGYHHNNFGDFVSLRLGVYAIGNGSGIFRDFRYKRLS